jgi:hypothetical protein
MPDPTADARLPSTLAAAALVLAAGACGEGHTPSPTGFVTPLVGEIPVPAIRKGDAWEYEAAGGDAPSRWQLEVDAVDGDGRFRARRTGPSMPGAADSVTSVADYSGPWNVVQPVPAWNRRFLEFPLRQGERWTRTAAGPGEMTWTLAQEVKGRETLTLAGAQVDCVRVEGVETTTTTGPPSVSVAAKLTLWYCPELRGVGRVDTAIPGGPVVTQTLVAFRPGAAAP